MRKHAILIILAVLLALPATAAKKLIEFGWDEPDTALMRAHLAEMEQMPFDGWVFHVMYDKPGAPASGNFMLECWSKRRFEEKEFASARDDLRQIPRKQFTHNFLRFNVVPGDVQWFDDEAFAAVVANAKLAAMLAREAHAAG